MKDVIMYTMLSTEHSTPVKITLSTSTNPCEDTAHSCSYNTDLDYVLLRILLFGAGYPAEEFV
jgi:hypothetical protein